MLRKITLIRLLSSCTPRHSSPRSGILSQETSQHPDNLNFSALGLNQSNSLEVSCAYLGSRTSPCWQMLLAAPLPLCPRERVWAAERTGPHAAPPSRCSLQNPNPLFFIKNKSIRHGKGRSCK